MQRLVVILTLLGGLCRAQVEIAGTQYSEEARIAGLEGSVLVTGVAGADGVVRNIGIPRRVGLGLDELAAQIVAQHKPENGETGPTTYWVNFTLPEKQSHWHLVRVGFKTPPGIARPAFAQADYPVGPGISLAAYDEAQIMNVIGRAATVTLAFDIDEHGDPGNFKVVDASADIWGPQAAGLARTWRFHPGMKAGMPVAVPCTVSLIWGPADFNSRAIANQVERIIAPPPPFPPQNVKPMAKMVVSKVEPEYTDEARQAGLEGGVVMRVIVGSEGNPAQVMLQYTSWISTDAPGTALVDNAIAAMKQWRFQPQMLNGSATPYSLTVRTDFYLAGVVSSVLDPPASAKAVAKRQ